MSCLECLVSCRTCGCSREGHTDAGVFMNGLNIFSPWSVRSQQGQKDKGTD